MKEMHNSHIGIELMDMLKKVYPNGLTYGEITQRLGKTRKLKANVSQALAQLCLDGKVVKDKKRYKLSSSPLSPSRDMGQAGRTTNTKAIDKSPKLIEGIFDATSLSRNYSYAFVRTDEIDYFVDSEDILNAYHGDKVMIEPLQRRGKTSYAAVRRIVTRNNEEIPGDIAIANNSWIFLPSNPKIHNWFETTDVAGAVESDKVMLKVIDWGNPMLGKKPRGLVSEILGKSGDPQVELLAVIRQYKLPLSFPDEVINEVQSFESEITQDEISKRHDLRDLFTFTIDPASAKDFDDAISIKRLEKGWRLWVHIADVAHYLPISSKTFMEASKRGNSFYFPKKVIPMIPERLSNLICSLRPEEEKLCMTVETDFNFEGKVLKQSIYESVIRSNARLAYEEVDALFEGKSPDMDAQLVEALFESLKLSKVLSQKRMEAGYIFFDLPEIEYFYDNDGFVHKLGLAEETPSHKLIENFMLVANEYVAEALFQKAPFSIYRIHEDPDMAKIEKLLELLGFYGIGFIQKEDINRSIQGILASLPSNEYHKVFDRIILRSMKKAKYSPEHIRHFGLALENYTHFTSPIRRLCDLVVHHLAKIYLLKSSDQLINKQQIKLWSNIASEQELQADAAERDIERVYSSAYMKEKEGMEFSGMIVSAKSSGVIVRLNEIPISAILKKDQFGSGQWEYHDNEMRFVSVRTGNYYQLLDLMKVKILNVSDDIYLEVSNSDNAHIHLYQGIAQRKVSRSRNVVDDRRTPKKSASKVKNSRRKR